MPLRVQRFSVFPEVLSIERIGVPATFVTSRVAHACLLSLIVLGGLWLRLHFLGSESLWLDEATSHYWATKEPIEILEWQITWDYYNTPLYILLLHYWLVLGDSEFILRLSSALLGTISIVVVYYLGALLFDLEAAFYSAFLLAISPAHIMYSQEARAYALLVLIGIVSSHLHVRLIHRSTALNWLAYVILATLGLYTHYFFFFLMVAHNFFALVVFYRRGAWSNFGAWVSAQAAVMALFLPFLLACFGSLMRELNSPTMINEYIGPKPGLIELTKTITYFGIGTTLEEREVRYLAFLVFGFLALHPFWFQRRGLLTIMSGRNHAPVAPVCQMPGNAHGYGSRRIDQKQRNSLYILYCLLYLTVPVVSVFLVSQFKTGYTFRYSLAALPGFLLIVALGIRYLPRREVKILFLIAIALVSAFSLKSYYGASLKDDWRGVANFVMSGAQSGDLVVFSPKWTYKPFAYYSRDAVELYEDLPLRVNLGNVEDALSPAIRGRDRLWLVRTTPPADPGDEINDYLSARFTLVEKEQFRGVGLVALYELTRTPSNSSIPAGVADVDDGFR